MILRRLLPVLALLLLGPGEALAQATPGFQSGGAVPSAVAKIATNGLYTSGGDLTGDALGRGVNPFAISDGSGLGLLFVNTTNISNAHVAFGLGHDADGNGLLKLYSAGGAAEKTIKCDINGVVADCLSGVITGGAVTSVGLSVPAASIFGVTGSPVTSTGTLGLTTTGTSGGIPYFSSASALSSSGALTANAPVIGGGAGAAPTVGTRSGNTTTFGTTSGALTSGNIAIFDASGNLVASGAAPVTSCAGLSDDGAGCTAGAASTGTAGIVKLHNVPVAVGWPAGLDPHNVVLANIDQASTITKIVGVNEVLVGAAATVSIYKAASGVSCGSGTILHSGSFDANASLDTNQTLTLVETALAAGDRICLQTTGGANWTGGSGVGTITVFLAPS